MVLVPILLAILSTPLNKGLFSNTPLNIAFISNTPYFLISPLSNNIL